MDQTTPHRSYNTSRIIQHLTDHTTPHWMIQVGSSYKTSLIVPHFCLTSLHYSLRLCTLLNISYTASLRTTHHLMQPTSPWLCTTCHLLVCQRLFHFIDQRSALQSLPGGQGKRGVRYAERVGYSRPSHSASVPRGDGSGCDGGGLKSR